MADTKDNLDKIYHMMNMMILPHINYFECNHELLNS